MSSLFWRNKYFMTLWAFTENSCCKGRICLVSDCFHSHGMDEKAGIGTRSKKIKEPSQRVGPASWGVPGRTSWQLGHLNMAVPWRTGTWGNIILYRCIQAHLQGNILNFRIFKFKFFSKHVWLKGWIDRYTKSRKIVLLRMNAWCIITPPFPGNL